MSRSLLVLPLWLLASVGGAQEKELPDLVRRMTLRPAAAPEPALRYQLFPSLAERSAGNAALVYYRAIQLAAPAPWRRDKAMNEKMDRWWTVPMKDLPRTEVRAFLDGQRNVLRETELAARRHQCDWQFELRTEGVELVLPEVQEMRMLARLLSLRARLEIAEGKHDDALHTVQTLLAMAKHVGEGPTLIQALVGMAFVAIAAERIEEMIESPGAPNLYWALTSLPQPLLDMWKPIQGEMTTLDQVFPQLRELESTTLTAAQAQQMLEQAFTKYQRLVGEKSPGTLDSNLSAKFALALMLTQAYPEAKRALIARGRKPEQVEAMPAAQVVALHGLAQYLGVRDNLYKWFHVPYWQARAGLVEAEKQIQQGRKDQPALAVFLLVLPAVSKVHFAASRTERRLAFLRCLEALRLHAAAHDGKLPARLDDITDVPVPIDPTIGKAFEYRVDGDKARLVAPPPTGEQAHAGNSLHYELTVAR